MKQHGFKQRLFEPLKSTRIPKVILFTDTETHPDPDQPQDIQIFTLGWIFTWETALGMDDKKVEKWFFDSPETYCIHFEASALKYKSIMIMAHNIFFDLQASGFFKYFTDKGWDLDWIYDKGLTYILRIKKDKLKIMILSSTNYYDCSLKKLGEMIGLAKQEISFENATPRKLKQYCYRDTEIVQKGIWYYLEFIKENELGRMAFTKSSQALVAYRTRFMNKKIYLHSESDIFELERSAYKGGRTEAFQVGEIPGNDFVSLDINSMYPYVMQKYRYPVKMVCKMEGEQLSKYTKWLGHYGMIAQVELDTPDPVYAVHYNKKLIFPVGRFQAFLTTQGLKHALAQGHLKKIHRAALYELADLFSEYVDYFQGLTEHYKNKDNAVMVKLCKYMKNTLYGKWGEREIITDSWDNETGVDYRRQEIWDPRTDQWWIETYFMNKVLMQHQEGEGAHSFPAIAAHITENARLELWDLISEIGRDKVLYCDTDSVIIRAKDMHLVKWPFSEHALGALKIQGRYKLLRIDGAKNYRTDDTRHIKGIPDKAVEISPGVFEFDSFQRQIGSQRDQRITGVKIESVTRRLLHHYDKGEIQPDGSVKPYSFTFFEPLS